MQEGRYVSSRAERKAEDNIRVKNEQTADLDTYFHSELVATLGGGGGGGGGEPASKGGQMPPSPQMKCCCLELSSSPCMTL